MEKRPQLSDGLTWRKKSEAEYYEDIYFNKQYRGRRLRGSSGTANPEEAERRLRLELQKIDDIDIYGKRPDVSFRAAAAHALKLFEGADESLLGYARHADILDPYIGSKPIRLINKDTLKPFIAARKAEGVSVRTINMTLAFVRMVLRRCAYYWHYEDTGLSWLESCPIISFEKGDKKKSYPLSWEEQDRFFNLLPQGRMAKMALFCVNTGLREHPLIHLRWAWETWNEVLGETVFVIPKEEMKNGKEMILILNRTARQVLESMRDYHDEYVFGKPMHAVSNNSWKKAWKEAGLPTGKEYRRGVHNLRHTFSTRLRNEGVSEDDRKDLMHHLPENADITRNYSHPQLKKLKECVEKIVRKPQLQAVA